MLIGVVTSYSYFCLARISGITFGRGCPCSQRNRRGIKNGLIPKIAYDTAFPGIVMLCVSKFDWDSYFLIMPISKACLVGIKLMLRLMPVLFMNQMLLIIILLVLMCNQLKLNFNATTKIYLLAS